MLFQRIIPNSTLIKVRVTNEFMDLIEMIDYIKTFTPSLSTKNIINLICAAIEDTKPVRMHETSSAIIRVASSKRIFSICPPRGYDHSIFSKELLYPTIQIIRYVVDYDKNNAPKLTILKDELWRLIKLEEVNLSYSFNE